MVLPLLGFELSIYCTKIKMKTSDYYPVLQPLAMKQGVCVNYIALGGKYFKEQREAAYNQAWLNMGE